MNTRAALSALLILGLTGCFRVTIESDRGGSRGSADDRVHVQRGAEGAVGAEVQALVVENAFGPVTVTGAESGWGWEWKFTCWGKDIAAAEARAEKFRMDATTEGTRLRLRLEDDLGSSERTRFESSLTVRVPWNTSVEVQNRFGEVQVLSVTGNATVRAEHGKVRLREVGGAVEATTSFAELEAEGVGAAELTNQNGAVRVVRVAGPLIARTSFTDLTADGVEGTATLRNQNGAITATHVGGDLDAETSFAALQVHGVEGAAVLRNQNGQIEAHDVAGVIQARTSFANLELDSASPAFDARNQNGGIRILARSTTTERIEATTSFSSLEVQLPATARPVIRAETSFGKIHSDFPVLLWSSVSDSQFEADPARPKLSLKGQNGDISIRRAPDR